MNSFLQQINGIFLKRWGLRLGLPPKYNVWIHVNLTLNTNIFETIGNFNIHWVLEDIGKLLLIFLGVKNGIVVMLKREKCTLKYLLGNDL